MHSRSKNSIIALSTLFVALLLGGAVVGRSAAPPEDTYRHLQVFTEVLHKIKSDSVEEPDIKGISLGAVNGLLESIDPYASYLNADQYKQWLRTKETRKAGTGLIISKRYGYVGVVDVVPGSPAAKGGLNTNDIIETINGVSTRDMPLAFAELLLMGDPGTPVEIGVLRITQQPNKIKMVREVIKNPAIETKLLADGVGHIKVQSLEYGKVKQVSDAVAAMTKQGAKRLVLDLRNNAIGGPEDGIALANLFLDSGLVTYSQGQKEARKDYNAEGKAVSKLPLVVITNKGTAGGAEIAAAALLDNKRAELVGERTYGNAAVRRPIVLDDGSAIILSTAKYYSPSGKAIQDTGVTPSVPVIEFDPAAELPDDDPSTAPTTAEPAVQQKLQQQQEDTLLKKAIEVVVSGKQAAAASGDQPAAQR